MADFKALLAKQSRLGNYIKNFISNCQKLKKSSEFTVGDCRSRTTLLKTYWEEFFQNDLLLSEPSDEFKEHSYFTGDAIDVPFAYTAALTWLDDKITEIQGLPSTPTTPTIATIVNNNSRFDSIKLPRFDGQQRLWDSFKDKFSSLIIKDPSISPIVKFHHLINALDGEAAQQLCGFEVVGIKFDEAWKHLCATYDNRFMRVDAHLASILQLPTSNQETVSHMTRLITTTLEGISVFKSMSLPVDQWDVVLIHILKAKLAPETHRAWVRSIDSEPFKVEFPSFEQFKEFIQRRIREASMIGAPTASIVAPIPQKKSISKPHSTSSVHLSHPSSSDLPKSSSGNKCKFCARSHFIAHCEKFASLITPERRSFVLSNDLCFNCLSHTHKSEKCFSKARCLVCGQNHHSRLHIDSSEPETTSSLTSPSQALVALTNLSSATPIPIASGRGILATALVVLQNSQGHTMSARALLDPCAEESIISEFVVNFLDLPKVKEQVVLTGAGGNSTAVASYRTRVVIKSPRDAAFALEVSPLVLRRVSALIPPSEIQLREWCHLKDLQLADPHFGTPSRVDCVLGSAVFGQVILPDIKRNPLNTESPVAMNTLFGWVLIGANNSEVSPRSASAVHLTINTELSRAVERLWAIEEVPTTPKLTPKEEQCANHFQQTHYRNLEGRFVVRLPFCETPTLLGSKNIAVRCLQRLEKRFRRDPELLTHYSNFIQEYEMLGHLQEVQDPEVEGTYLPHHPVWKRDSKKIRVVFNASQGDFQGRSLNTFLHSGPKLQLDIIAVLCRWAFFRYAFTCDIIKMFRQFLVDPEDRHWQRILWRDHPSTPMRHLELSTVTYGTACAPFLANACLIELANQADIPFQLASNVVLRHRYVDDFFAGADSAEDAEALKLNLITLLKSACLELDKFASNYQKTHGERVIPVSDQNPEDIGAVPVLGLVWDPADDSYRFKIRIEPLGKLTKRSLLSLTARLFDPVGWISPVVVRAKIIIQSLWLQGSDWDTQVPASAERDWAKFYSSLSDLTTIRVPRWVYTTAGCSWELQGFADASERAYAAVIYIVSIENGRRRSALLTSKTKVAPIKTLQLPRLELCAAHLLAKLIQYLLNILLQAPHSIICWSDSRNVLTWLSSHPSKWQTFVANRVSEIHTFLPKASWNYVRSGDNPADLASRGCTPAELQNSSLWWKGPEWLESDPLAWKVPIYDFIETHEEKRKRNSEVFLFLSVKEGEFATWIRRFSSIDKLIATWAYCIRWFNLIRKKIPRVKSAFLSASELEVSRLQLVRLVQQSDFPAEIKQLQSTNALPESNRLKRLCPFLDAHGVMRVGGRLNNALLPDDQIHPAILDASSHFTELLIRRAHKLTLHGGVAVVQGFLNQQYWIDRGRNVIRKIIGQCAICIRHNSRPQSQQMAPLPSERVRPSRPFTFTGLDYAGPFSLKKSPGRGSVTYKGYIAIFVCLSVKAIHLEVVSAYTTAAFLAALRRFTARRGLAKVLFSDNGTNFHGAATELRLLFKPDSSMIQEVATEAARQGMEWRFIPPSAPHFGGLWEGNIRAVKRHLIRVLGETKLTFEEFSTVLTQIEACLNSRPLYQGSSDGNDLSALTPGHFLIGSPLLGIPDHSDIMTDKVKLGDRWKLLQQLLNSFWKRWKTEYLCSLQQRSKWLKPQTKLQVSDVVIIKSISLPPTQWALGKVIALHTGPDGLNRVATIKTATTELTRPVHKLIRLLPTESLVQEGVSES